MSSDRDVAPGQAWHGPYHDTEYGFPLTGDAELFERLMLEINQAGLSWLTVLKKREAFRDAYRGFEPDRVARFGTRDVTRLLGNAAIIRNRLKVQAAIANARTVRALRKTHGSFAGWLDANQWLEEAKRQGGNAAARQRSKAEWVALFKKTFRFTGGEIVGEFLLSTGYLPGAHRATCPVHARIVGRNPPWMRTAPAS